MKRTKLIGSVLATLLLPTAIYAQTTFIPGVLKRETYIGVTRGDVEGTGALARGISVNTDTPDAGGTVLATISSDGGGPVGGMMIAEWPAGASLTHDGGAGTDVLGGKRLVFLSGSREANGITSESAGIYDLLPDGEQMFLNAVAYMAGSGTNVIWVTFHPGDDTPSAAAGQAGFKRAPDAGYTDVLEANGYHVTRYITTGSPNAATLNSADVVIISRSVSSGDYSNDGATAWNTLTVPIIDMGGYTLRSSRLGFTTGGTMVDTTGNIKLAVNNPAHAIFAGIAVTGGVTDNYYAEVPYYPFVTGLPTPTLTTSDSWNVPAPGLENYASRDSGTIMVDQTGDYDFYVAADDDTDLFISTDSDPAHKYLIAQETGYSSALNWITPGGNGSTAAQKDSATWVDANNATPHASGIHLVAGQRYYLEAVHHQGNGGDNMSVTMVPHTFIPSDGEATTLTNGTSTYGFTVEIGIETPTPTSLSISSQPSDATAYSGTAAQFSVGADTDSEFPPAYQWRRDGTEMPGATGATLRFIASPGDDGATFDCIVGVPGGVPITPVLSVTSTVATLTVPASGAITANGYLKRELFLNFPGTTVRQDIEAGAAPAPSSVTAITNLDVGSAGSGYGERISGYFTPTTTDEYVFFIAADDDSDLFLSTDDDPANKRLICQEDGWSNNRSWQTVGGAPSTAGQKRSDMWTNSTGVAPYANGIHLVGGTRYYIEAVHHAGGGGNGVSATFVTTNDVFTLALPYDDDPSALTGNVISYATTPVSTFAITNQPQDVTVFEGINYTFSIGVDTDSEVNPSYQWKKNGTAIANATGASYTGAALLADNNAQFTCDVIVPGQTPLTSSAATLHVQAGVFSTGQVKLEAWTNGVASRADVGGNVAGLPAPDVTQYVNGFDMGSPGPFGDDYVDRVSGFFVPPVNGVYVFFLSADDDTDLYISTDERPENKVLIAQEGDWSNQRSWNTPGGGGSTQTQRRSDSFTPDGGTTYPGNPTYMGGLELNAGSRYYLEAVHHQGTGGDALSVTYANVDTDTSSPTYYSLTNAPVDGDASRLVGNRIGVLVPAASLLNITNQPQSVATYPVQPVYFTVAADYDGVLPPTYQWRRDGVEIAGATTANYGFITSPSDDGAEFDCIVALSGSGLYATSSVATVTVQAGATFVSGSLAREFWGPNNNSVNRTDVEAGRSGPPQTDDTITVLQTPDQGADNYTQRIRGFFVPPTTTNYIFYVSSDDDSDLFLSTDDDPLNKRLIAQVPNYDGTALTWEGMGQGSSQTWSPDAGVTHPYTNGIALVAGEHYYLEAVHHEGGGGDHLAATYSIMGDVAPTNGTPSALTGSVIGYLEAPTTTQPVLSATLSGGNLDVSWTPAGGTLQSTPALEGASTVWTDVGTDNPASIPVGAGNLFLRVEQ